VGVPERLVNEEIELEAEAEEDVGSRVVDWRGRSGIAEGPE